MKKILFVIGTLSNGGAERVISVLAEQLSKKGYEVGITTVYNNDNDYIRNGDINIINIEHKFKNRFLRAIQIIAELRKIIKKEKPDIVISFVWQVNIYTILSNIFNNTKLVISERNDPYSDPKNRYLAKLRNRMYSLCDGIVFQTEDAKNYFNSYINKKSTIIANPIKPNLPYWNEKKDDKTIITACRLMKQKNLPLLFDAFKDILNDYPEYVLKVFGEGELRNQLTEKISSMGLNDKIKLEGFSNNIHNEMASSSVFVISSDYEGISNSMLEALAIGVPVVSTDSPIGGARMFIESGKNGVLTSVGDCTDLYNGIKFVLDSKEKAINISYEARKIREKLEPDIIVNQWIDFCNEVINN